MIHLLATTKRIQDEVCRAGSWPCRDTRPRTGSSSCPRCRGWGRCCHLHRTRGATDSYNIEDGLERNRVRIMLTTNSRSNIEIQAAITALKNIVSVLRSVDLPVALGPFPLQVLVQASLLRKLFPFPRHPPQVNSKQLSWATLKQKRGIADQQVPLSKF